MGEPMMHVDLVGPAERLRAKVLQLHERLRGIAGPFPLPEASADDLESGNSRVAWDDIRPKPPETRDRRKWMAAGERVELEAAEAEWAESVR